LVAVQADMLRRMEDLRRSMSAELASSVKALSDAMTMSISDLGKATTDAIKAIGSAVEGGFKTTNATSLKEGCLEELLASTMILVEDLGASGALPLVDDIVVESNQRT
jgi:hypothetical protein